jgi:uncharacterized protein
VPNIDREAPTDSLVSPSVWQRNEEGSRPKLFWRVAIVFVGVVVIWQFVVEGIGSLFGPAYSDRVGHTVRAVAISMLVIPLIVLARRYLDRRSWEGLRLTSLRVGWRAAVFGAMSWLVAAGFGLVLTLSLSWARIEVGAPSTEIVLLAMYLPLLVFLYEALPEELIFRGYFYRNLAARYARWLSVLMQAALFTLWATAIGAAGSVDRLILFFTSSVVLGILRVTTGNLWASIGFHLACQWVTQLYSAAIREGSLQVQAQPTLELVVFWFFPIVLGSLALIVESALRKSARWRDSDLDPPSTATGTLL